MTGDKERAMDTSAETLQNLEGCWRTGNQQVLTNAELMEALFVKFHKGTARGADAVVDSTRKQKCTKSRR